MKLENYQTRKTEIGAFALALLLVSQSATGQTDSGDEDVYNLPAFAVQGQQLGYASTRGTTALKFSAPILETPQSLFVINDALIEDQQAFRFDQILQNDSSIQKRNNFLGAYSSHYARGFSLENGSNYLRNGRSFFHLASPPVEILERTEVLKGPSSVLYGTMAPGGMINMVSKRPIPQRAGFVKGTIGSDSLLHFHLDTGGALNQEGTVSYRLNLVNEDSEYFRSFADGQAFDVSRQIAYMAIDWNVSPSTVVRFNADVTEDDRPQDIGLITDGTLASLDNISLDTIISQPWSHYNSDVWNAMVEVEHRFSELSYSKLGYSFQDFKRDRYDNQIRGEGENPGDITMRARRRVNRRDYHTFYADYTHRVEAGEVAHNFLVGADRTWIDRDDNETERNENHVTNIFNPIIVPDPVITTRPEKNTGRDIRDGLYVQDMIEFGDQWRALLGLRYDDFDTKFFVAGNQRWDYGADNLTPRAGVVYLPNPDTSIYLSYSESFEPNSPVGSGFDNTGEALDPTVGEMVELGAKWELMNDRLLVSGALFTIDRANSTFEDVDTNTLLQTGLQRNEGFETAVTGLVNENLTVTASLTYLDAEYVVDEQFQGNTPAGAGDLSVSLWGEYQFSESSLDGLSLQGGWFHESDRPIDNGNTFDLPAYDRFDVGLKYAMPFGEQGGVIYRLTASNVFDETYFKGDSPRAIVVERPREVRFSIQYTY